MRHTKLNTRNGFGKRYEYRGAGDEGQRSATTKSQILNNPRELVCLIDESGRSTTSTQEISVAELVAATYIHDT